MSRGLVESLPAADYGEESIVAATPCLGFSDFARSVAYGAYRRSGLMAAQECVACWRGREAVAVVLFHRVTDEIAPDGLTVSTAWFRGFCDLMRRRFHVIPMAEMQRVLASGQRPTARSVVITFDDCYRDNLPAARVLADYDLSATFFIPTQYVGTDHAFDWDVGLKRMPNLTWDDVRAIAQLGHSIGSHSVSHADMGLIHGDEARYELLESKRVLEDRLAMPIRWFAYPFSGAANFRPVHWPLAQELGYDLCFSAMRGFVQPNAQGNILPRLAMPPFRSLAHLELNLSGSLDWFYGLKRRLSLIPA
ncbi:MAG: polysaccharide deacetylase family protein [Gemmataceae bacterium]|nr:polysaccharide deacetylase family protein [Gemmataceae bacterium]